MGGWNVPVGLYWSDIVMVLCLVGGLVGWLEVVVVVLVDVIEVLEMVLQKCLSLPLLYFSTTKISTLIDVITVSHDVNT